ncbi:MULTISPECIES: hypothetical protein [Aerococcus]|uniref:hypothetical protein n=1 Tax=Aerococcus TaxID=1375 RepID=UPI000DCD9441|nr:MULTISPECIES: hypothetical protein [Aerococcus]KAA9231664.1 hypothetical protein F6I37_08590 [Aerococcus mictus]MDK6292552.1 hypothetical protein [Aerococcus urinae]MDK6374767.1 hypothetical protein [Aerococcus urinae]MDK6420208.1 hypothetical protein [Aerococcus urinae]MDK8074642.1 hypothetical protein [Aerococcus urinae]
MNYLLTIEKQYGHKDEILSDGNLNQIKTDLINYFIATFEDDTEPPFYITEDVLDARPKDLLAIMDWLEWSLVTGSLHLYTYTYKEPNPSCPIFTFYNNKKELKLSEIV